MFPSRRRRRLRVAFCVFSAAAAIAACGWDPSHPFERDAPPVKEAIALLDGGDALAASSVLERYLTTGECKEGNIGTPDSVKDKSRGSFDLGLALFQVGESFGGRFGDEEIDAGLSQQQLADRGAQIDCALRVAQAIADNDKTPYDLRARARYLEGNLHFLAGAYEEAVAAYDKALTLAPGMRDAGDAVGRDAAWNRAIAMRRIEDRKDAGQDGGGDAGADGGGDGGDGGGGDGGGDAGNNGGDGGSDGGDKSPDAGPDSAAPPPQSQDAGPPPPPSRSQDDRMLDQLERAPTVQEEAAKRQAKRRTVRGMADK